jgi:hypothetical protein
VLLHGARRSPIWSICAVVARELIPNNGHWLSARSRRTTHNRRDVGRAAMPIPPFRIFPGDQGTPSRRTPMGRLITAARRRSLAHIVSRGEFAARLLDQFVEVQAFTGRGRPALRR